MVLAAASLLTSAGCESGSKPESRPQTRHEALGTNLIQDPGFDTTPDSPIDEDDISGPPDWGQENGVVNIIGNGRQGGGDRMAQLIGNLGSTGNGAQLVQIFDAKDNTNY